MTEDHCCCDIRTAAKTNPKKSVPSIVFLSILIDIFVIQMIIVRGFTYVSIETAPSKFPREYTSNWINIPSMNHVKKTGSI